MNSNDMINQIKTLLGMEAKLAQAKLENGTVIESDMTEGSEIFIVTEEERIAMPIGEYQLEDGQVLIVEEEGIIASVGVAEEAPEEEVEAEVAEDLSEEVTEENLEEEKEEMGYATKEELAEVKSMIEDIKAMIEKKEEMSEEVSEEKEELSAVEKVTHNPEVEDKKMSFLYGQSRPQNTMDRVMSKISQIKK
jgi:hypothetical protein